MSAKIIFSLSLTVFAFALRSQPVLSVSGPSVTIPAGYVFTLSISISGTASIGDQALQFSLPLGWRVTPSTGAAAIAAGKTLTCASVSGNYNCIVAGLNGNTLVDGEVASLTLTVPPTTSPGVVSIGPVNLLAAMTDNTGKAVGSTVVAGSPFLLTVGPRVKTTSQGIIFRGSANR